MPSDPQPGGGARRRHTREEKRGPPTIRGMIDLPRGHYDWVCPNFFIFPRVRSPRRGRRIDRQHALARIAPFGVLLNQREWPHVTNAGARLSSA
jgi:hypothetical protein